MNSFRKTCALGLGGMLALAGVSAARADALFDQGKLLATGGVTQIEGAGGSGLTTWALITGYGTERGIGINAHQTFVALDDFTVNSSGVAVGLYDRLELSATRQWFGTGAVGTALGLGDDFSFSQDVWGAKLRLFGNALYPLNPWLPQVALGIQYKHARNGAVLDTIGSSRSNDVDFYLSATKAFLAESLIATATVRLTRGSQFGLLGFGGDSTRRTAQFEGSLAYMLRRNLLVGVDYRTKPDVLAFARERDAAALYVAYFLNKNLSVTLAAVDLGPIAQQSSQRGLYLSFQAGF
jgi:Protein of unknown function (DUF3034)